MSCVGACCVCVYTTRCVCVRARERENRVGDAVALLFIVREMMLLYVFK